jgi:hypothetical protein
LAEEATVEAGRIEPRHEVGVRSLRPYLLAALIMAGVMGLVFCIWPRAAGLALTRVVAPMVNLGNVPAVELEIRPGDHAVAVGEPVTVEVLASQGSMSGAELEVVDSTGYTTRRKGQPTAAGDDRQAASWHFPAVMSGFEYRVRVGRALSRYYTIAAVPRPKMESVLVRYDYPEYTALAPKTVSVLPKVVEAVAGTRLAITVASNVPVARPQLTIARTAAPEPAAGVDPQSGRPTYTWTVAVEPGTAGLASILLEGDQGVAGDRVDFEIRALPDNRPSVAIVEPQTYKMTLKPRERLVLKYRAGDDFGLSEIDMQVRVGYNDPVFIAQPMPADVQKPLLACQGEAALDLSQLDLGDARQLTVQMRAADTLPVSRQGPNRGTSMPLVIEIDRSAEPVVRGDQAQSEETRRADEERKRLDEQRQEAERLKELSQRQERLAQQAAGADPQRPPDAPWQQEERKVAEQLAETLQQEPPAMREELKAEQRQAAEMSQEAKNLAAEQRSLQRETQADSAERSDPERLKRQLLDELARQQKGIAADTARLQSEGKAPDSAAAKDLAAAQEQMKSAAEQISRQQPGEAAKNAHAAQDDLEEAVAAEGQSLAEESQSATKPESQASPPPPAGQPSRSQRARELAQRQESLAGALDALEKNDVQKALAEMEQGVRQQAEGLQERAEELAGRTGALGMPPSLQESAGQAAQELEQAAASADEARESLTKGSPSASGSERQAEQSLEKAAEALATLGKRLGERADQLPAAQGSKSAQHPAAMASAFEEATEAAATHHAADAAESAREAARALAQAADAAATQATAAEAAAQARAKAAGKTLAPPGSRQASKGSIPGEPGSQAAPGGSPAAKAGILPPQPGSKLEPLATKPKTGDTDWVKFRGQVKREAADRAAKDADDEYRDLVNRYFEELSRQGTTDGSNP